jgi:hypothetical protein
MAPARPAAPHKEKGPTRIGPPRREDVGLFLLWTSGFLLFQGDRARSGMRGRTDEAVTKSGGKHQDGGGTASLIQIKNRSRAKDR